MTNMKDTINILLVEDEKDLSLIIRNTLTCEGFNVRTASDGEEGLRMFYAEKPDVLVADVMMPKMDGFTMVRQIRQTDSQTPVLFLTARSAIDDVVEGFELGANDYLKKPFGMRELMVRIRALAGRMHPAKPNVDVKTEYRIGEYTFYPQQLKLEHLGVSTELSPREATILKMLCDNKGEVLNMRPLLLELWGDDSFFNSRSLQVFISKLRRKLEADPRIRIVNVRGEGYRMIVDKK